MDELAGLPESVRKLALDRFRLLQPHSEERRPLRPVAVEAGIPYRTAQRWVMRYREFGLAALARKPHADTGERRAVAVKIREAIEGLALQKPPIPIAALYRQVQRFAQDLGEKVQYCGVVYSIVRCLPADLVTLAHQVRRPTGKHSTWFTGAKRLAPMPFGKPVIRHSIFCSSALMATRRSPGSRSCWMITAAPWLDISFLSSRLQHCGPHWRCARNLAER